MKVPTIFDDKRTIEAILFEEHELRVGGPSGVTAILPYQECGEHCYIVWLAIYKADFLWQRIPANTVESIIYQEVIR